MSIPVESSPASNSESPRRRGPARWLIAAGIVALALAVAAVAILPRLAPSESSVTAPFEHNAKAASQVLSLLQGNSSGTIKSLDPVSTGYTSDEQIVRLLFDRLVTTNDANNVEMWGADRVNLSSDGLTYTFHLHEHQSFSDGTPVKPSDYVWSLDRALNPCLASALYFSPGSSTGLTVIKDSLTFANETCAANHTTVQGAIKTLVGDSLVPDDSAGTLTITLAHPAAYFLAALAQPYASVIERQVVNGLGTDEAWLAHLTDGPTGTGGSGIFYLASRDTAGNLVLKPNPHWWGASAGKKPNLTEIDVHSRSAIPDYAAFLSSPYDYVDVSPPGESNMTQAHPAYQLAPELFVSSVTLNWKVPPFDNADARQALCLAINRDTVIQRVAQSIPTGSTFIPYLPTWHLVPQGMPGYDTSLTGIDGVTATSGDLAKAEAHWQTYLATLNGKAPPPVVFTYNGVVSTNTSIAQTITAQWANAFPGLKASASQFSFVGPITEQTPFPQVFRFGWIADYPDPQDFLSGLYATNTAYNRTGVNVPSADVLLASADAISDPVEQAARLRLYNQAEQQLVQQVATCPLFQYQMGYLLRTDIYGMRQNGMGIIPDDDWVTGYRTA